MSPLRTLAQRLPGPLRRSLAALRSGRSAPPGWSATAPNLWAEPTSAEAAAPVACNICRWSGEAFEGTAHVESARCPTCGSIARDRFLLWCFARRTSPGLGLRILETSPRMDDEYRRAMARWFDYRSSDYDERAHRATLRLDLQAIDLPSDSVDVLLTPHVLEHVPDTERALAEIWRILVPGGAMFLQVPVLQGRTAPPAQPEFHGDRTPVFWRFGFDLTARLREAGFATELLVTRSWHRAVTQRGPSWPHGSVAPEFDVDSMLRGAIADDLSVVAEDAVADHLGFTPGYQLMTWHCRKPGPPITR